MKISEIRDILEQEYTSMEIQTILLQETESILKAEKNERIIVFENKRVLKIRKPEYGEKVYCRLCIGFPFSIAEFEKKIVYSNVVITYHFQGKEVRLLQTEHLQSTLNTSVKYLDSNSFKQIAAHNINQNFDEFIYIDPFRFLGDSYISLRIYDEIKSVINSECFHAFSYNEILHGASPFQNIHPIKYIKENLSDKLFIVQPDFIDDQFLNTTNLIQEVKKIDKNIILWILGRNMIIVKDVKINKFDIYKNSVSEFILWNDNKEIMLANALDSFFSIDFNQKKNTSICRKKILINIYSSSKLKDLNLLVVQAILNVIEKPKLLLDNSNIQFQGYWQSVTLNSKIDFRHSFNLSTSYEEIKNSEIIFTSDTAIAHVANRLEKISFVIYNIDRWDNTSFLSIIHSSFLGFASHNIHFIPILISFSRFKEKDKISALFNDFLRFFDFRHIPFSLLNPTINYINAVVNDYDIILVAEKRKKFIERISYNFTAFVELERFYNVHFPENKIQILEKEIVNIRLRLELISPTYKLALMIMKKLMTTQHSRP